MLIITLYLYLFFAQVQAPILPTALLRLLSRGLDVAGVEYAPDRLLDPQFVASLDPKAAKEVRHRVLVRIRDNGRRMATLRNTLIGETIKVPPGFDTANLGKATRAVLHRYLQGAPLATLSMLTWGEALDVRRTGVQCLALMTALAELECALAEQETGQSPAKHAAPRLDLQHLIDDERLAHIEAGDLRYGWRRFGNDRSLKALLERWQGQARELDASERAFVSQLERGLSMSLAEDISDIGKRLATAKFVNTEARSRAAEIFAARYGARDYGPELEAIGKRHGCSGSRVSKVEAALLKDRGQSPVASPAALAIFRKMQQFEFLESGQLEAQLELKPGSGHSLEVFRRFCLRVLRPTVGFDLGGHVNLRKVRRGVAAPYEEAGALKAALRYAQRECRISGAASLTTVAGALALDSEQPVLREALRKLIDVHPKARWLDRDHAWFALDDLADSLVYARVRKILAVAKQGVSIREIGEALWRCPQLAYESGGEASLAPMPILKAAILGWPDGIIENADGNLTVSEPIEPTAVLSPLEHQIYAALAKSGGIGTGSSIARAVDGDSKSVASTIQYAPFVEAIGHGVYALRGWPVGPRAMLAALAERVAETKSGPTRTGVTVIRMH